MAGKRVPEQSTYVTPRTGYRYNITAKDDVSSLTDDNAIPAINTIGGPNRDANGYSSDVNMNGKDARLLVAAGITGFSSVTLECWLRADLDLFNVPAGTSSSSDHDHGTMWVLASSVTVTKSSLWVVKDIPPGIYKILVSAVSSTGSITLRTQFAA